MTFIYYIYLYACIYYIMQLHSDYILWQPFLDIYSNAIYSLANSKWSMRVRVKKIQTFTFMFLMYVAGKPHSSKRFSWIISAVRLNVYQAQADSIRYKYNTSTREDKFQEKPHVGWPLQLRVRRVSPTLRSKSFSKHFRKITRKNKILGETERNPHASAICVKKIP